MTYPCYVFVQLLISIYIAFVSFRDCGQYSDTLNYGRDLWKPNRTKPSAITILADVCDIFVKVSLTIHNFIQPFWSDDVIQNERRDLAKSLDTSYVIKGVCQRFDFGVLLSVTMHSFIKIT